MLNNVELSKTHNKNTDSADSLLQVYFEPGNRTFYPVSGSYQSAVSGDELNNFKNKVIIGSIIKLYNSTYSRLIDNGKMLDDRWAYLRKKYIHQFRTGDFHFNDDEKLSEIMDDMYYHYLMMKWYKGVLTDTIVEIDGLLKKINNEIL
jgi:hypothetical protein